MAAGDLFFHGFDVGAELEEELGDAGDDSGFVVSDEGDGGEMLGHSRRIGGGGIFDRINRFGKGQVSHGGLQWIEEMEDRGRKSF